MDIIGIGTIIVFLLIVFYVLKRRICPYCKIPMARKLTNDEEIIYVCKKCGAIKKTGMYFGGGE
jgi:ribosomal protein L37AE/L43A